jgi:hypothetical protein
MWSYVEAKMTSSEIDVATNEFVDALAAVLEERNGAPIELRSKLAKARAKAEKLLSTKQYSDAVFRAARIAGHGWE